jgi:hypothetical protein
MPSCTAVPLPFAHLLDECFLRKKKEFTSLVKIQIPQIPIVQAGEKNVK